MTIDPSTRRAIAAPALLLLATLAAPSGAAAVEPWSPLTADVLFMSNRDGNGEIYLQKGDTKEWLNLTKDAAGDNWPEWSPDSKLIVFQSKRSGNLDLWRMDADGSNVLRLTDHPEADYLPAWSPDGESIYFASWRKEPADGDTRANHAYVMAFDGSAQRRFLAESPKTSEGVAWGPNGLRMVLARSAGTDGADLFLADSAGKVLQQLTTDGAEKNVYNGSPDVSPDGKWVAFYSDDGTGADLVLLELATLERRVLLAEGQNWYPRFSPDGRWLIYTAAVDAKGEDLDLFAIAVEGGEKIRLVSSPGRESEGRWKPEPCPCR